MHCLQLAGRALDEARGEFMRFKTTRRTYCDAFTPPQLGVFDSVLCKIKVIFLRRI